MVRGSGGMVALLRGLNRGPGSSDRRLGESDRPSRAVHRPVRKMYMEVRGRSGVLSGAGSTVRGIDTPLVAE